MIILRFLIALFIALCGLAIYLFVHLGLSKPVTVTVEERGPFHFLYQTHLGAYHDIGPKITAVEEFAREQKIECPKTFGEFLDDPGAIEQDRLRSKVGCIVNDKPSVALPEGFSYELRPASQYAVGHFEGSPAIGPFKVYPKVKEYILTERLKASGAVIETYLIRGEKVTTEFLFPVELNR